MKKAYNNTIKVYDTLGKRYIEDSNIAPQERSEFIRLLSKGARVLDVGCGGGRDTRAFVAQGFKVTGVDLSFVMIKEAKKQIPQAIFKTMDVLDLNFPGETFDVIWANAVLLHLDRQDVSKALKKFYKILKPNGIVHIRVKKGKGEEYVKEKLSGWHERFYTYFSKKEFTELVKNTGFKIIMSKIFDDELGRPEVKWITVWGRKVVK